MSEFNWTEFAASVVAKATEDGDFRASLLSDAGAALADAGMDTPADVTVTVVVGEAEDASEHTIVLPDMGDDEFELGDDDLDDVSGGGRGRATARTFGGQRACGC